MTTNTTEKMRTIYTQPAAMDAWIRQAGSLPAQLTRATHCMRVAQDPQSRFGLTEGREDVAEVCSVRIREIRETVYMMIADLHTERAQGLTWGECMAWRYDFGPADVRALGIAWFGTSPEIAARLSGAL